MLVLGQEFIFMEIRTYIEGKGFNFFSLLIGKKKKKGKKKVTLPGPVTHTFQTQMFNSCIYRRKLDYVCAATVYSNLHLKCCPLAVNSKAVICILNNS